MKANFLLIFILFLHISMLTKCEEITLSITSETDISSSKTIGTEGIFTLVTDRTNLNDIFDPSEIENYFFEAALIEDEKRYNLNCSLFDPENMNVVVKCHLLDTIHESSSFHFSFSGGIIEKDDYTITIKADENYYLDIEIKSFNIPFIYSDAQIISLNNDDLDSYELRFKVNSYQGEKLALVAKTEGDPHSFTDFDEFKLENNDLICNISKKKIEETITYQKKLNLVYLNEESGIIHFEFAGDINIEYDKEKQNINLNITAALNKDSEKNSLIAFGTNIKDISPLTTDKFNLTSEEGNIIKCFFKKYDKVVNLSLILLCEFPDKYSTMSYGNINLELNNINYKYNFKIVRISTYKILSSSIKGKQILLNYPEILDFKKNKNYTIEFFMKGPENYQGIRFVENSPILECETKNFSKKCILTSSHFIRNETGYYHTLYMYNKNRIEISYDSRPIKVIVPYIIIYIEEQYNKNELTVGQKGLIYFTTSYKDTEDKFNSLDIEERTKFNTTIYDEEYNEYEVNCRFWKPENKNLVIICELNEDLKDGQHIISFNDTSLDYDDYIINIFPKTSIKVNVYNFNVSFIYSDEQIINIDNNELYDFKFKYELFNKSDLFFIKNSKDNTVTNFAILDKCEINEGQKELLCVLTKEKIESFLTNSNEQFSLGFMNDEIGMITYDIVYSININYEIEQKENVFVQIGNLLETNTTQRGTTFAFNTNVTDISNLRTKMISFSSMDERLDLLCYFKKDNFHNLLLICMTLTEENIILNTIVGNNYSEYHYKYNFIVPTFTNYETVYIRETGIRFLQVYPEILNFTSEESITIRYLISSYDYSENKTANITLNPDSSELECKNLTGMIKCIVPRSHFENKESGYYYTRYLNQEGNFVINYDINKFNVILPPDLSIKILLENEYNNDYITVGKNGTLYFITSFNDTENIFNSTNIQNETSFETFIKDRMDNIYNVTCRLWKPLNDNLRLFCDLKEPLIEDQMQININDAEFNYYNYTIKIISKLDPINIEQYDKEIPFIYSANQTINIEEEKDSYEIKFNIGKYNNENLFLEDNNIIILDDNEIEKQEIICKIKKEKLEEKLQEGQEIFILKAYVESVGMIYLGAAKYITITKRDIPKDDIYVGINKLLYKTATRREYIAFETNITNISNILTKEERLIIKNIEFRIALKKSEQKPLLLLIRTKDYGNYSLNNINEPVTLDQIHSKYNFIITPVTNEEVFEIQDEGTEVVINYPEIFNFTENDSLIIKYLVGDSETYKNIKINPDSEKDLDCHNDINMIECILPKSHFERKPNGYYYTYHLNHLGEYSPFYLLSPIKVILPIENEVVLRIDYNLNQMIKLVGKNGTISFVTDLYDEINLFNISEIEEKSLFISKLKDDLNNEYNASCRLWKPINENIRVFCDFEGIININAKYINLNNITFEYNKQYNITIIQVTDKIQIKSIEGNIPFLYSDNQKISIEDNINTYEIKFKSGKYNNELLELSNLEHGHIIIDDCSIKEKELICTLKKEEILDMLGTKNKFSVSFLNDFYGYDNIVDAGDIIFDYNLKNKEDINVEITHIKENITEENHYITYETNVSYLDNMVSSNFSLMFTGNYEFFCFFKKSQYENLYLLCTIRQPGIYYLEQETNEIELDEIHYKYNFKIKSIKYNDSVEILSEEGHNLDSNYPKILNFSKENSINIILTYSGDFNINEKLKLNPKNEYLNCENLLHMIKCIVPISHFNENGNYSLLYQNSRGGLSTFYEISPFEVILPEKKKIEISIEEEDNNELIMIGKKGVIYLVSNYKDTENIFDLSEIENFNFKIYFSIINQNKDYSSNCIFWEPKEEKMGIICQLDEDFELGEHYINLKEINFLYKEIITIEIKSKIKKIKIKQLDYSIPFLYSDKQEITLKKNEDIYNLKFRQLSYDQKPLYLYKNEMKNTNLENCRKSNSELICDINKIKLLEILSYSGEKFFLGQKLDTEGLYLFNSVFDISFNYTITKEDINIKIGNLLTPVVAKNEFIVYETDINNSNISSLISDYFDMDIKSGQNINDIEKIKCIFKSNNLNNLLLLCDADKDGIYSLGQINSNNLNNINILYNFKLEESTNNYEFEISDEGTKIYSVSPLEIIFKGNETQKIKYEAKNPERLKGIQLNKESNFDLDCEDKIWYKECSINKTHFSKNGSYYTYHSNHKGGKTISYEIPQIKITFEKQEENPSDGNDDNEDSKGLVIGLSIVAGMIFVIVIVFLVWHYLRRKNSKDISLDINKEDIELKVPISSDAKE